MRLRSHNCQALNKVPCERFQRCRYPKGCRGVRRVQYHDREAQNALRWCTVLVSWLQFSVLSKLQLTVQSHLFGFWRGAGLWGYLAAGMGLMTEFIQYSGVMKDTIWTQSYISLVSLIASHSCQQSSLSGESFCCGMSNVRLWESGKATFCFQIAFSNAEELAFAQAIVNQCDPHLPLCLAFMWRLCWWYSSLETWHLALITISCSTYCCLESAHGFQTSSLSLSMMA